MVLSDRVPICGSRASSRWVERFPPLSRSFHDIGMHSPFFFLFPSEIATPMKWLEGWDSVPDLLAVGLAPADPHFASSRLWTGSSSFWIARLRVGSCPSLYALCAQRLRAGEKIRRMRSPLQFWQRGALLLFVFFLNPPGPFPPPPFFLFICGPR